MLAFITTDIKGQRNYQMKVSNMPVLLPSSWTSRNVTAASDQIVIKWLFSIALLVAVMIVIGGVTRLTGSGLSMVEWRPLMGTFPPMTTLEWQRVYQLYQAFAMLLCGPPENRRPAALEEFEREQELTDNALRSIEDF